MSASDVRLTPDSYVIKLRKGSKTNKRNKYVWKLRQNYFSKSTLELRLKVALD